MKSITTEVKVGLFGLLAFLILLYMTVMVGNFSFLKAKGGLAHAYFKNVAGLDKKSVVRVAGVEAGKVEDIILEDGRAKVTIRLKEGIALKTDAIVYIRSESFLGEKYLEIDPGSPNKPDFQSGGVLKTGEGSADLDRLMQKFDGMAEDISAVVKPLKELFSSEDGEQDMKGFFKDINYAIKSLNETIFSDRERLNRIVSNIDSMAKDFRALGDSLEKGEGSLGKLVKDDSLYMDVKQTFEDIQESLPKLQDSLNNFYEVSQKLNEGGGSLGKLINDKELYDQAKKVVENINTITTSILNGEGTIGKLYKDDSLYFEAKNTLKKLGRTAEGMEEQAPISALGVILGFMF